MKLNRNICFAEIALNQIKLDFEDLETDRLFR